MQGRNKFLIIFTLGLLSAIGPFSIDMYLPGFAAIARDLHTSINKVAYTLSGFFIGISAGQLLYGPLLDKYGRKKPLFFGITLYIMASIGCAFSTNIEMLIALRFLQAVGGCAGMVAARAMVRDLFSVEENARIFSLLMLVIGISPIVAPTLGGYITGWLGWSFIFYVLAFMGFCILCLVYFVLPETKTKDNGYSLMPSHILKQFFSVLRVPQFLTYAITGALTASALYAYIAGSPHVFMDLYKVSPKVYGWIFSIIAAGLITATQVNTFLLKRFRSFQIVPVAIGVQCLVGLTLVAGYYWNALGLVSSIVLCCLFLACQGLTFPNASALAIAPFASNAGSASALLGCIQMAVGTLSSATVSYFQDTTALPMAIIMALCAFTALVMLLTGRRFI